MRSKLLFAFLLVPFFHFGATYYVSPGGNNAAPGTSAQPWKTVQYGIDQLVAGDQLLVNDGVYNEKLVFHVSGSPGSYIAVIAAGNGAVLDGTGLTGANAMIDITDHSYIQVQGFEIRNNVMNDAQGILIDGNCQGIKIQDNKLHDIHFSSNPNEAADETKNAQALIVFGSSLTAIGNLEISGNEIYNCRLGYSEGLAVNGNVDGFAVTNNNIHDLTNIGIVAIGHEGTCSDASLDQARNGFISDNITTNCNSPYAYCGGIYVDGAKRITIFRNSCTFNDYGIEIGCEHPNKTATEISVRNNMIFSNRYAGLAIGGYDYPTVSGSVTLTSVYNNTFFHNDSENDGMGEVAITYIENASVQNNIFYPASPGRALTYAVQPVNLLFDYNLYYVQSGTTGNLVETTADDLTFAQFQQSGQEAHGMYADAGIGTGTFTEQSASPQVLGATSVVVNAGNPAYQLFPGETDYFGNARIAGGRVDIGAGEYSANLGLPSEQVAAFGFYPNPVSNTLFFNTDDEAEDFMVSDPAGKVLLCGKTNAAGIDVSALVSGTYLLTLPAKGTARFVKL